MPTLAQQIADDWQCFDGVEDVTFTPKNPDGTPVTGVKALRRVLTRKDISMLGPVGLEPQYTPWHLWFGPSSAPSTVPTNLDLITDGDGVVWRIQGVDKSPICGRWRAMAIRNA